MKKKLGCHSERAKPLTSALVDGRMSTSSRMISTDTVRLLA